MDDGGTSLTVSHYFIFYLIGFFICAITMTVIDRIRKTNDTDYDFSGVDSNLLAAIFWPFLFLVLIFFSLYATILAIVHYASAFIVWLIKSLTKLRK